MVFSGNANPALADAIAKHIGLPLGYASISKFSDGEIPLPSFWGGYRIVPAEFEFWQGRENRLHDRFRYTKPADVWVVDRLSP